MYRLFLPRLRRQAGAFVTGRRIVDLNRQLNKRTCPEEAEVLKDKARFYKWCTAHDIPTAPVLASFKDGSMTPQAWKGGGGPLPRKDLFSKNADQWWGNEATRWRYVGNGRYEGEKEVVDQVNLLEMLRERSSKLSLILQEYYINHASIAGLTSGGLSTVRVVTGRLPDGEPEPLFAAVRMPTGGAVVDNFSAGGLAAPINLETGCLGAALPKRPRPGPPRHAAHPDTGHPIEEFHVPRWHEVTELGVRAHRAFTGLPFIGWDIALTDEGPLVVEGNEDWGPATIQTPHGCPLTDTAFQEYYDAWMRYCLDNITSA